MARRRRRRGPPGWARAKDVLTRMLEAKGVERPGERIGRARFIGDGLSFLTYTAACEVPNRDGELEELSLVVRLARRPPHHPKLLQALPPPVAERSPGAAQRSGGRAIWIPRRHLFTIPVGTALPKRFVSRERLCLRGTTDYWVNDALGQPYFAVSRPVDRGMLEALRTDIVPRLLADVPGQPSEAHLQVEPYRHRFIVIFDREAYSPAFFKQMWDEHRIA
jgi:hypothetical protein